MNLEFIIISLALISLCIYLIIQIRAVKKSIDNRLQFLDSEFRHFFERMKENFTLFQTNIDDRFKSKNEFDNKNQQSLGVEFRHFFERMKENFTSFQSNIDDRFKSKQVSDNQYHQDLDSKFKNFFLDVRGNLESVQKNLVEMKTLATEFSDFRKIFTNVKSRGVWGEIQLETILSDILHSSRYIKNAKIKEGSVEFALQLPGKENKEILLPIDSKFPQEDYQRLQSAYETSNKEQVELCQRELRKSIEKEARRISEKYIDPPRTTDFAVMFLPVESLYIEILKDSELVNSLQKNYRVIVSGPTTFAALINSFHLGFQHLEIEKRSSEIVKKLSELSGEFVKFRDVVDKLKKQNQTITNTISETETRFNVLSKKFSGLEDQNQD